jgi:methionyl-tRNA formyltransferase
LAVPDKDKGATWNVRTDIVEIVFFGTPEFAVLPLRTLLREGYRVLAVVTQPDRQSGRGRHLRACPVKMEAENAGLPVLQPERVRNKEFIGKLNDLAPEAIVVVAYGQILPPDIIHMPKMGCINIHASLLPDYRGAAPINWAIIQGRNKTGVTTMLMDEGMDTGPILLQQETNISDEDTAGTLSERLATIGAALLIRTLRGLAQADITPIPQTREATYAPPLKKTDGRIEWSKSADELSRMVRGMNPWPGAYCFFKNERINILRALPVKGGGEPGIIERVGKDYLVIGTGSGGLSILLLQPSGKPEMPVLSFLQGRTLKEGMSFDTE